MGAHDVAGSDRASECVVGGCAQVLLWVGYGPRRFALATAAHGCPISGAVMCVSIHHAGCMWGGGKTSVSLVDGPTDGRLCPLLALLCSACHPVPALVAAAPTHLNRPEATSTGIFLFVATLKTGGGPGVKPRGCARCATDRAHAHRSCRAA